MTAPPRVQVRAFRRCHDATSAPHGALRTRGDPTDLLRCAPRERTRVRLMTRPRRGGGTAGRTRRRATPAPNHDLAVCVRRKSAMVSCRGRPFTGRSSTPTALPLLPTRRPARPARRLGWGYARYVASTDPAGSGGQGSRISPACRSIRRLMRTITTRRPCRAALSARRGWLVTPRKTSPRTSRLYYRLGLRREVAEYRDAKVPGVTRCMA